LKLFIDWLEIASPYFGRIGEIMDIYLIRYFLALVESGSFTKAAQACLITQPTLSAGIKRLEDELGVALFVRSNRRVFLTEAGTRFLSRAKAILNECNLAMDEAKSINEAQTLRLGVVMTLSSKIVAGLLRAYMAAHPFIQIDMFEGTEQELSNRLSERGIDVALSLIRQRDEPHIALFDEPYELALSCDHPLADKSIIKASELVNQAMIVRTRCEVLSETSRHFTDHNVRPPLVYRTAHDERALEMAGAGLGVTVMPKSYANENVVRIPMEGFGLKRTIGVMWRTESPLVTQFSAFAKAYFPFV